VHLVKAGVAGLGLVYLFDSATINLVLEARRKPGPHWELA